MLTLTRQRVSTLPSTSVALKHLSKQVFSSTQGSDASTNNNPEPNYQLVYRFPYIRPTRFLARLKIYQTLVTVACAPLIQAAVSRGELDSEVGTTVLTASCLALGTLYCLSNISRKLVCIISIDEEKQLVRLGRLTFWGNRRNIIEPVENIVPLSEINVSYKDVYTDIKTYNGSVNLYLPIRFGGVHNVDQFHHIFGKLKD